MGTRMSAPGLRRAMSLMDADGPVTPRAPYCHRAEALDAPVDDNALVFVG